MEQRYTFRPVSVEQAGEFGERNGIFQQTKEWTSFRGFYRPLPIMGFAGDEPVLSCIVYRLPVCLTPFGIGYATRGPVCDWKNEELIAAFFAYYKDFAKKNRIAYTIFDPYAERKIDFGDPVSPDPCVLMEQAGLVRNCGVKMQPANDYRIVFDPSLSAEEEEKRIYGRYTAGLKTDIENAASRGITLRKIHGTGLEEGIDVFYDLFEETHKKKGFGAREKGYYLRFAQCLSKYVTLYLYRYDHEKDIALTRSALDGLNKRLEDIRKEWDDPATTDKRRNRLAPTRRELESQREAKTKRIAVAKEHSDDPWLSAWFFLSVGNRTHYLYGANSGFLRDLRLTSNYHDMVADSIRTGKQAIHMGGSLKSTEGDIRKDPMYDVYLHKSKHNGEFAELAGEYFLITYPRLYRILHGKLNYFRRIVFRKK